MTSPAALAPANADIARLVAAFYAGARADALLGPVFEAAVSDWPHHLAALTTFWTAQLRGRGSYRGTPLAAHRPLLPALTPAMFARWLTLWQASTAALMSPEDAATLQAKAADLGARMSCALFPQDTRRSETHA